VRACPSPIEPGGAFRLRLRKHSQVRRCAGDAEAMHGWVPILIMIGLGAGFGIINVTVPRLLGPKKPTPEKEAPYECGMPPVGDARERHPVKFYLVAMIFLLFDIEVAFLYPFAMAIRELRWFGFVQLMVFFAILLVGYVYVWRKGVLDWGRERTVSAYALRASAGQADRKP
jgi:NADH-quinone oxidoreductase subunit A